MLFIADAYGLLPHTHTGRRAATGYKYAVYLLLEKIHAAWQIREEDVISLLMLIVSGAFDNVLYQRLVYCLRKRRIPIPIVK